MSDTNNNVLDLQWLDELLAVLDNHNVTQFSAGNIQLTKNLPSQAKQEKPNAFDAAERAIDLQKRADQWAQTRKLK